MKHQFLALTVLAASGLFAQNNEMQSSQASSCGDPCAPCKPCCVPAPRKCIDCECYSPAYYNLQCDWGAFAFVDFLYWYGGESGTMYASAFQAYPDGSGAGNRAIGMPSGYSYTNTGWDPGFRVGLGWNTGVDGWDLCLDWTYYHNSTRSRAVTSGLNSKVAGAVAIDDISYELSSLTNPGATTLLGTTGGAPSIFSKVSNRWTFLLNSIDFTLGRKTNFSRHLALRPFAGIRGAWTRRDLLTRSRLTNGPVIAENATISRLFPAHSINKYWGVGFVGGAQANVYFMPSFSLYANADYALLWGKFQGSKSQSLQSTHTNAGVDIVDYDVPTVVARLSPASYQMRQMTDIGVGISWDQNWCADRYRTELAVGWEHHLILNHVQDLLEVGVSDAGTQLTGTDFESCANSILQKSDVGLGGLQVRFRFDF